VTSAGSVFIRIFYSKTIQQTQFVSAIFAEASIGAALVKIKAEVEGSNRLAHHLFSHYDFDRLSCLFPDGLKPGSERDSS